MSIGVSGSDSNSNTRTYGLSRQSNYYDPDRALLQNEMAQAMNGPGARTGSEQYGTSYGQDNPFDPGPGNQLDTFGGRFDPYNFGGPLPDLGTATTDPRPGPGPGPGDGAGPPGVGPTTGVDDGSTSGGTTGIHGRRPRPRTQSSGQYSQSPGYSQQSQQPGDSGAAQAYAQQQWTLAHGNVPMPAAAQSNLMREYEQHGTSQAGYRDPQGTFRNANPYMAGQQQFNIGAGHGLAQYDQYGRISGFTNPSQMGYQTPMSWDPNTGWTATQGQQPPQGQAPPQGQDRGVVHSGRTGTTVGGRGSQGPGGVDGEGNPHPYDPAPPQTGPIGTTGGPDYWYPDSGYGSGTGQSSGAMQQQGLGASPQRPAPGIRPIDVDPPGITPPGGSTPSGGGPPGGGPPGGPPGGDPPDGNPSDPYDPFSYTFRHPPTGTATTPRMDVVQPPHPGDGTGYYGSPRDHPPYPPPGTPPAIPPGQPQPPPPWDRNRDPLPGGPPPSGGPTGTPSGGLLGQQNQVGQTTIGGLEGMLRNPEIANRVQQAIQQQGALTARAGYANAGEAIQRNAAATGNTGGQAAAMAELGRNESGTLSDLARQNSIAFEQEAQRRKETALSGLSNMYGQTSNNYNTLLGLRTALSSRPVSTGSGTSGRGNVGMVGSTGNFSI